MVKPKVVIVINNPQNIGGPTIAMRRIINSDLNRRFDFYEITISEKLGKVPRFKVVRRLIKELRSINPDIIHITGLQLHGFYGVLSSRLAGYKNVLLVVRGSSCDAIDINKKSRWIFGKIIEPSTLRMSKITYTVSTEMANNIMLKKNIKNFGGVIHNPAPIINNYKQDNVNIREELNLKDTDVIVVYTGRIVEDKGLSYALNAMMDISEANIKFVLIGEGADEQNYKNQYKELEIQNRLFFLGKRNDVIQILKGCDIFLFPTLHENLSNSLLEACSVGLAVIATNVGGNPEVIRDGVDGILIPPKDKQAIVGAIKKLENNLELRKALGENAIERIQKKFSQDKIYHQLENLYNEIL